MNETILVKIGDTIVCDLHYPIFSKDALQVVIDNEDMREFANELVASGRWRVRNQDVHQ